MFFDDSRSDRAKRANRSNHLRGAVSYAASPIPPAKPYEFLTHEELTEVSRTLVADVETYRNYFLVGFKCIETSKVVYFECFGEAGLDQRQCQALAFLLYRHRVVGFNSANYDLPMIGAALLGLPAWKLKEISDEIIIGGMRPYELARKYNLPTLNANHIDIMEVAPIEAPLKLYAARIHCERLQDLPFEPDTKLTPEQMGVVRDYNLNDLDLTAALFKFLAPQIELREAVGKKYGIDLRSKSDAQVSEAVIGSELRKRGVEVKVPKIQPGTQFQYKVPEFIQFKTPQFQAMLETVRAAVFTVQDAGSVDLPEELKNLRLVLGKGRYQMGIGGLHSTEKSVGYVADEKTLIIDRDVASFYPNIILNSRLYPQHLGPVYLEVFGDLTKERLRAKMAKDTVTADGLKITINGGFGKLGNKYSIFYSPDLLIQVTLTGQLSLLMLIEMIELAGIPVISANTDGIVMACPADRYADLETVIIQWEERTGFQTEETRYKALWSRDVNNYIAVKEDGKCKLKGVYAEVGSALNSPLSKNPEAYICSMAVQNFLANGVPVAETIENMGQGVETKYYPDPVSRFVAVKRVRGGAAKHGVYLGKVVRWYYAKDEEGPIITVSHGNTVGKTEGAKPLMTLPKELPADLDIDWYINEANEMLYDLGRYKRPEVARLF